MKRETAFSMDTSSIKYGPGVTREVGWDMVEQGAKRVMVPPRIADGKAPPIPVNYRLRLNHERWLVYDVVIDGVSLITNYRSQFATEVRRSGIDGLISSLATKNQNVGK